MSHFLFGDFSTCMHDKLLTKKLREQLHASGVLLYLDDEIDFCQDIRIMLRENACQNQRCFILATELQRYNSDDLLFPYEKYSEEYLFPAGNDRSTFNRACLENLKTLEWSLSTIIDVYQASFFRVFVVDGYDDEFEIRTCDISQMMDDIANQVERSLSLNSVIYRVNR